MASFKVTGLSQLQANIGALTHDLQGAEKPAGLAAGEPIRAKWQSLVPVYEGHYRDSLVVVWMEGAGAVVGTSWLASVDRDEQPFQYSKRLEFGDTEIHPHPSARPAMKASRKEALAAGGEPFAAVIRGRRSRRTT